MQKLLSLFNIQFSVLLITNKGKSKKQKTVNEWDGNERKMLGSIGIITVPC